MKKDTWWILATLVTGVLLAPAYQYKLNPDGMAYLMLARALAAGDFAGGTSLYWGPLFSWCLVPFLWADIPELLAIRLLQAFFAGSLMFVTILLMRTVQISPVVRVVMHSILAVLALYYGMIFTSPDLLLLMCFCGFLAMGLQPDFAVKKRYALYAGIFAGTAVLAKHVAFPFFFLGIPIFCILWIRKSPNDKKALLRRWLLSSFFFLAPSIGWIAVMTAHAGKFTLGGAGKLIYASEGPGHPGLPILNQGLFPPSLPHGLSVWDDPFALSIPPWGPFDTYETFLHQIKLLILHTGELFTALQTFTPFALCILLWAFLRIFFPYSTQQRWILSVMVAIGGLLAMFYLPILIDQRYFWLHAIFLVLAGSMLCSELLWYPLFQKMNTWILLSVFFLSFTLRPFWYLLIEYHHGDRFAVTMHAYADAYNLYGKRFAADDWKAGLFASYFSDAQYYGKPKSSEDAKIEAELVAMDIDAYLVWGREPAFQGFTAAANTENPTVFLRDGARAN